MKASLETNIIFGTVEIIDKIEAILEEKAMILRAISKDKNSSVERQNKALLLLGADYGYQWHKDFLKTSARVDALKWGSTLKVVRKWAKAVDEFFDNKEAPLAPEEYNKANTKPVIHLFRT